MALRFVTGPSGSGKSKYVFEQALRIAGENLNSRVFVIVPDQFTMQTQADLVNMSPGKGIMNIEVLSFQRLAYRIFGETGGGRTPVMDDTGKNLILRTCAKAVEQDIPYLAGKLNKPGFIHEIKSAISEFMQYGIDADGVLELTEYAYSSNRKTLARKLNDLSVIYKYFLEYIDGKYITTEGLMDVLAGEIYKSELMSDSFVILDGFTGFTPIQNKVILALLKCCKTVVITLCLEDANMTKAVNCNTDRFMLTRSTMNKLIRMCDNNNIEVEDGTELREQYRFNSSPELLALAESLFVDKTKEYSGEVNHVYIDRCKNIRAEVRLLAHNIRNLTERYTYRDIAVITGNLNEYESDIAEIFDEYEIPVYIDKTKEIALNPFVEFIRATLNMYIKDFTYESVVQYLRCGFSPLNSEESNVFEDYIFQCGIRGFYAYNKAFSKKHKAIRDMEPEESVKALEYLNELRSRILTFNSDLIGGGFAKNKETYAGTFTDYLMRYLERNNAKEHLEEMAACFGNEEDYEREKEYSQIYEKTLGIFEQIKNLIGDEEISLEEYYRILDSGFSELEVGIIPKAVDRVIVGDMERTRLNQVKVLFFIGMNDGWVPKSGGIGGIISDADREFLTGSDMELAPSPREKMYIGRFYLYSNLTKPSDEIYISYSSMDNDSKAMRPSYVIGEIGKILKSIPSSEEKFGYSNMISTQREARTKLRLLARKGAENRLSDEEKHMISEIATILVDDKEYADKLIDRVCSKYALKRLDQRIAMLLNGAKIYTSVSRIETYAKCAYSYYLKYMLNLQSKEEYGLKTSDMGSIYHSVLEIFIKLLKERGLNWRTFDEDTAKELIAVALETQAAQYVDALLYENNTNQYITKQMQSIMLRTVMTLQKQLKDSAFEPMKYEYKFNRILNFTNCNSSSEEKPEVHLTGRIDRVDTARTDNGILVKVVDYKSGNRDFSLMNFYKGTQLQLVVYLSEAVNSVAEGNPGEKTVPAAMLYYHMADPVVAASGEMSEEEVQRQVLRELRGKGLINADDSVISELDTSLNSDSDVIRVKRKKDGGFYSSSQVIDRSDLDMLCSYAEGKILSITDDIIKGRIDINPVKIYTSSSNCSDSCEYCDYKGVCGFDSNIPGYVKEEIPSKPDEEILYMIREELADARI